MTAIADLDLKQAVRAALDGVLAQFDAANVRAIADGQGGAWIEIVDQPLGPPYAQADTSVIGLLPFNLPNADIYPLLVRPDLTRLDGAALGPAFQTTSVQLPGEAALRPVTQISRRTRGEFPSQTAAQKMAKVLEWVRNQ